MIVFSFISSKLKKMARFSKVIYSYIFSSILSQVSAFDATSNSNVAVYWGQASAGSQERLSYYCESDNVDIILLSFMNGFPGTSDVPTLNFAGACTDSYSNGLLHCTEIAEDIASCQSNGKKVLLSLGGAVGDYGFSSDSEAETFAGTLWNLFGEGTSSTRPFDDSVIDGFDLDLENQDQTGYPALLTKLREYFQKGSKDYYISAAPQCVYPDASLSETLTSSYFDFVFVQFYNNYCSLDKTFNWNTWSDWAKSTSVNSNVKVYMGLPGSSSAAGSGYVSSDVIETEVNNLSSDSVFGGVMFWDASQCFSNVVDDIAYVSQVKSILGGTSSGSSASPSESSQSATISSQTTEVNAFTNTYGYSSAYFSASVSLGTFESSVSTQVYVQKGIYAAGTTTTTSASQDPTTSSTINGNDASTITLTSDPSTVYNEYTITVSDSSSSTYETSTSSFTSAVAITTSNSGSCSSLSDQDKVDCLNSNFKAGLFDGNVSNCTTGGTACSSDGKFSLCDHSSWVIFDCPTGTSCYAFLSNSAIEVGCNYA